jgi:hypothetical protein
MKHLMLVAAAIALSAGTAHAEDEITLPTPGDVGWFASFGFGAIPAGVDGPGLATGELLQVGAAFAGERWEMRVSGLLAFESTYYQSSTSGLLMLRSIRHLGRYYSVAATAGIGGGSFSPMGDYNADNGGSFEVAALFTPVLLHFGGNNQFEVGFDVGVIGLLSFGDATPFYDVSIGYTRW